LAAFSVKYQELLAAGSYIRLPGILYFVEFYAMPSILLSSCSLSQICKLTSGEPLTFFKPHPFLSICFLDAASVLWMPHAAYSRFTTLAG
jgi:hypothetical protein